MFKEEKIDLYEIENILKKNLKFSEEIYIMPESSYENSDLINDLTFAR